MQNLMLHCGADVATIDQVDMVPVPEATETFTPIPHTALYEQATTTLVDAGMHIKSVIHALHDKRDVQGANYFALMEVESDRPDYNLVVGLRNSHIKEYSAALVLGSSVFVCDNLAFSGEVFIGRKHTKNIWKDLPALLAKAVAQLVENRVAQDQRILAYRTTELSITDADHVLMNLVRAKVIAANKVLPAWHQFSEPAHEEHLGMDGEHTVWTMFNAVTETYKGTNVFTLPARGRALHGVCDTACGLDMAA